MELMLIALYYLYTVGWYLYFTHIPNNHHVILNMDKLIPVIPIFIIPYYFATLSFLAVPILFYLKLGWAKTKAYLVAETLATTFAYATFAIFPTSVIREPIVGNGLFNDLLRGLYAADKPSGAFPSGHVYSSIIISYYLWKYFPQTRIWIVIILRPVIASTVLLKQHYVIDIVGGILVACISIIVTKTLKFS
jgi:membrane-associated phospholipid phosphatase